MTETEETLRYWLAQEDWYPSKYTQNFLEYNSAEEANETLARIAEDAQPEPHSYGALLYTAFATAGFMPSAGGKIPRRKAGVRAALLLAERGDPRCVPALIRVFETDGVWQNKYQEQIVKALSRHLSQAAEDGGAKREYAEVVAALAARVWQHAANRDLSPAFARLLLAAARYLRAAGSGHPILQTIAQSDPRPPMRREVRDRLRVAAV